MSNFLTKEDAIQIMQGISKKTPQGIMIGNTTVGHIEWQMYLMRDYLKLDGTPLANASNDYSDLLKFAQDNNLITSDTTDKSLFKYDSTNDVLTLPDFIGLVVQGGSIVEEKEAGLPDIEGSIDGVLNTAGSNDFADGAFLSSGDSSYKWKVGGDGYINRATFDASKSNPIYGNSNTVQPPAITLIPQIKYKKATVYEGIDLNKLMPLGSIISFMGTIAPEYYLACDGAEYNINEYSALANFFEIQFGSINYFGGDGTTTFAVPDLRGEFLRGTGTNSHENQGSGASVGEHQDGTEHVDVYASTYNRFLGAYTSTYSSTTYDRTTNKDSTKNGTGYVQGNSFSSVPGSYSGSGLFTSRPTNTSVLYCIKYK